MYYFSRSENRFLESHSRVLSSNQVSTKSHSEHCSDGSMDAEIDTVDTCAVLYLAKLQFIPHRPPGLAQTQTQYILDELVPETCSKSHLSSNLVSANSQKSGGTKSFECCKGLFPLRQSYTVLRGQAVSHIRFWLILRHCTAAFCDFKDVWVMISRIMRQSNAQRNDLPRVTASLYIQHIVCSPCTYSTGFTHAACRLSLACAAGLIVCIWRHIACARATHNG